jgi:peptidoglycan-N-acetylglucosamine deacetylase
MHFRTLGLSLAVAAGLVAMLTSYAPETVQAAGQPSCGPSDGLGVSRVLEIDTSGGPLFGDLTKFQKESSFLQPKEVVLTFDDGPMPAITRSILDTLDRHCTRATFFHVGKMAAAFPGDVKAVVQRGHTVGTHTWSHPLNIKRLKPEAALEEIEKGFSAVAAAAGQPIAPFFRFPGLSDNAALLTHLQKRGVGTFTVDVVSNDSYIHDAEKLVRTTMERVEARQGGIMLFHDIKAATARAMPAILTQLKARGYKVVHLKTKHPFVPDAKYTQQFANLDGKTSALATMVPFFGVRPQQSAMDTLAPAPKTFVTPSATRTAATTVDGLLADGTKPVRQRVKVAKVNKSGGFVPSSGGWTTSVRSPANLNPAKARRADAD